MCTYRQEKTQLSAFSSLMEAHLHSCILVVLTFAFAVSCNVDFILNGKKLTSYNHKMSCPKGYSLAKLNTAELWAEGVELAFKVLGHSQRVWIRQGLNWSGSGVEQWMILTPSDPKTCIFPPKDLKTFCIPHEHPKLALNTKSNRKAPSLCMKDN